MKKLIRGIVNFRKNSLEDYRRKFAKLALGQSPDALLIACCDSRVVPNVFASTDPGDLFVLRNIGNLVPPYSIDNIDSSVVTAIEFSVLTLNVLDIIVCGHSECGAMTTFLKKDHYTENSAMESWLKHIKPAYKKMQQGILADSKATIHNKLSQINVIQQLDHLKTYPYILEKLQINKLRIHGWWFDLSSANIYYYNQKNKNFVLLDENEAKNMLVQL